MNATRQYGRPRKRFGQNFLVDPNIVRRIVAAIDPQPHDRMVEIGPGRGALTHALLDRVELLHVVEIDRDLAAALQQSTRADRLRVHVGDALAFDFAGLGGALRVVGNLPYNISSPILFRLLDFAADIEDVHVMLQREVVARMVAQPGSADYGRLTVMLGYRFVIERLFRVPAGAFWPQPKVESAFARLTPRTAGAPRARDETLFARIVMLAFGQRRKTLRNALATLADPDQLRAADVDPAARGETLSTAQFVGLANALADAAQASGQLGLR
jgi:16S rRNA (adenine1518-N6/adenine1519-N6)-dimethyltransferase